MNWGTRIIIMYVGFVALIITLVVVSMRQQVDLVTPDYYAKELKYQTNIDKTKNYNELKTSLKCTIQSDNIVIDFPDEHKAELITGEVLIYKPSDAKSDKLITIESNNGQILIPTSVFTKGMYKVKVDWQVNSIDYFSEQVINL
jgi:hypothetical protein